MERRGSGRKSAGLLSRRDEDYLKNLRSPSMSKQNAPAEARALAWQNRSTLEEIPQELVVDLVMILHLGRFDEGPQSPRAAVGGSLL